MALSESELAILVGIENRFLTYDEDFDIVERASSDMRLVRAVKYMLGLSEPGDSLCDAGEVAAQIAEEYLLDPEGVEAAIEIAEKRALSESM